MHVEVRGQGPDLVLLHGWAMHGGIFATLIAQLESTFTLHVVDLPGHGHAHAEMLPEDLDAIADALATALPKAAWLGWSLGGLCAMQVALRHPRRVSALVALCSTPCFVQREAWPQGMPSTVFEQFAEGLRSDYRSTIDRFLQLEAQGCENMKDTLRWLRAHIFERGEPSAQALQVGLQLLLKEDLRARLPDIAAPSLWLCGRRDRLITPGAVREAAALCADSRYLEFEHGGHAPFITEAEAVAAQVRGFLQERLDA